MRLSPGRRAVLAAVIAWVPLALLTLEHNGWSNDIALGFYRDVAVHVRMLIGIPALILAERMTLPRLTRLARHFVRAHLVCHVDEFMEIVRRTRREISGIWTRVGIVTLAYALTALFLRDETIASLTPWNLDTRGPFGLSIAGCFHAAVSVPLLLGLVLGWLWRLFRWTQFLGRVARLEMRLVASHPDRHAGLGFLAGSLAALAPVGFALATLAAAGAAAQIVQHGYLPRTEIYRDVGIVIFLALLFAMPLTAFTPVLMRARHHGALLYGTLGQELGRAFESRWVRVPSIDGDKALEVQDFSANTDASSVIQVGLSVGVIPFSLHDFLPLLFAMVLPFAPIVVMSVPPAELWGAFKNLIL